MLIEKNENRKCTGKSDENLIVYHGAFLLFDINQIITIFMAVSAKAWSLIPALIFIIIINIVYISFCIYNKTLKNGY